MPRALGPVRLVTNDICIIGIAEGEDKMLG